MEKQSLEGSLTAVASGEGVVPASELPAAIKQIKELQLLLGKKPWKFRSSKKWWSMRNRENG
ncbi:transposase InsC for insertion element IS2A/D/F/H/I/K [Escherichia coli TA008]